MRTSAWLTSLYGSATEGPSVHRPRKDSSTAARLAALARDQRSSGCCQLGRSFEAGEIRR